MSALVLAGAVTGILTGLFGVGGGFLIVASLVFITKIPIKRAVTTSLSIVFLISISGFISHIQYTSLDYYIASLFIVGGIVGVLLANKIKDLINDKYLQNIFAIFLIFAGIVMLVV